MTIRKFSLCFLPAILAAFGPQPLCLAESAASKAAAPVSETLPAAISVKAHGARGDGSTDDTAAIQAAVAAAEGGPHTVFFPPGEYLISQGIYLHANLTVTGAPGAVLKKVPAVTQRYSREIPEEGNTVVVEDASAFRVGQDCYLWDGVGSAFTGTIGRITAVDAARNMVTFEGLRSNGAKRAYKATEKSVFSTAFSMLTSNPDIKPVENLIIEGLTFDCQKQPGEPDAYPLAPIHLNPRSKGTGRQNVVIRNNTILNSASDGISVQGYNNTTIENNRVLNCGGHGIHVGFTITRVTVRNNYIEDCGSSGIFWCYGVTYMVVTDNIIKNCTTGCGGIGEGDLQSVIAFNTFDGNGTGVAMSGNLNGRTAITENIFQNGRGVDIRAYFSSFCVISNNTFSNASSDGKQTGIQLQAADHVAVVNNQFLDYEGAYAIHLSRQTGGPKKTSQQIQIAGNTITGGKRASIFAQDSSRITISDNQITAVEGGKAIEIAASCSDVFLRDNLVEGEVINQAANQP